MASKSRYLKLSVGPAAPLSRRTSVMGARVVGEWNEDGQRMLLFERQVEVGKAKRAASRKTATLTQPGKTPGTVVTSSLGVANG